ncbi:MAG: carboxypeptidase regulatory-like domain-containing protein [Euryarchaeota archaeon]|nr:carboxypeptidase regulatory-like domain-containing protein [Euryarchaeota archaeon]
MARSAMGIAAALLLAFSGCVSDAGSSASVSASAAPPTFDEATGAIEGYVVNDAFEPLAGAQVGIKDSDQATTADAAGRFALGSLPPATYVVLAQALGYEAQARTILVEAGKAVELQFMLVALPTEEAFTQTLRFEGLIECAWGVSGVATGNCLPIQSTLQQYNLPNPTNTKIIGLFSHSDPKKVASGVFEMEWNPSAALTSGSLLLNVEKELTGIIGGTRYGSAEGKSPLRAVTTDDPWKDLVLTDTTKDQVQTRTFPAATNPPTFVANQRFTVYATACYVEECSDIFSAIKDA